MNDDKRAELLMDHYKDTSGILGGHWKARNRLFMFTLILLGLLILDGLTPGTLADVVNGYLRMKFVQPEAGKTWEGLNFAAVDFTVRLILLWLVIGYYQRSLLVERLYKYLHRLEERIGELSGEDSFSREGRAYFSRRGMAEASWKRDPGAQGGDDPASDILDNRPTFLRWVGPLYVYVFPAVLSAMVVWKLIARDLSWNMSVISILSAVCSVGIVVYSVLYVRWVGWRR